VPNGRKIDQIAIKFTNIFYCKTLQNLPKLGFLVRKETIWQPRLERFCQFFFHSERRDQDTFKKSRRKLWTILASVQGEPDWANFHKTGDFFTEETQILGYFTYSKLKVMH
jgi:hypothetical protein